MSSDRPGIIVLVRDLMMASKISATARAIGKSILMIRDPSTAPAQAGTRLIVDLNEPGAIAAAAEWQRSHGGQVVGFVSHTDVQTVATARAAGIELILARSQFVASLESLLE